MLTQPSSASAAERNWSVYGQIKTPARNRMQHATADKRVYCHETLHYQKKMQCASYKAAVAEWADSDSDSNVDDDDDDQKAIERLMV